MNVYWVLIPGIVILVVGFLAFELTRPRGQQPEDAAPDAPKEVSERANSRSS